jgi:hypothetical protein
MEHRQTVNPAAPAIVRLLALPRTMDNLDRQLREGMEAMKVDRQIDAWVDAMEGPHQARATSSHQPARSGFDPLVAGVWLVGGAGSVLTIVGAITVIRWALKLARG